MDSLVYTTSNVLIREQLDFILSLPSVNEAKARIEAQTAGSVYFSVALPSELKAVIYEKLGLDLAGVDTIPFRWIKGDSTPHIDRGAGEFEKTYLMYLTDSTGSLVLGEELYPITQGSAYVFPEGLRHETVGTGSEPRLLLGPMSEGGVAVGAATTISANGENEIIYFKYISGTGIFYRINSGDDIGPSLPITITNTNTSYPLKVLFETDINVDSNIMYFICGSDNIQFASESLKTDGTRPIININVDDYDGFIKNGEEIIAGYNNIHVYNLIINGTGHSLQIGAGWVGQKGFANGVSNNYIVNCSSTGNMPGGAVGSGGIVGALASKNTGELTILGCSSSGSMGQLDGGIVGAYAGQNGGTVTCIECYSTGIIGNFAGGIFGDAAGYNGTVVANKCYTEGLIGENAGGIYGRYAGANNGNATATASYTKGNIGADGGGIYGLGAGNDFSNPQGTTTATNCYSAGSWTGGTRGIYGTGKGTNTFETNCYKANGSWSNNSANTQLQGTPSPIIGTTWVSTGLNQPYELTNIGYSPYTIDIINSSSQLIKTYSQSIQVGNSSIPALISGKSYTILEIENDDGTITIDSNTGALMTTSQTTLQTYTIYVRNTGSYHITTFSLTVLASSGITSIPGITCCDRTLVLNNTYNEINTILRAGNTISGGVRRGVMSYSDMIKLKMALASKR
jgi:hypothetical protein